MNELEFEQLERACSLLCRNISEQLRAIAMNEARLLARKLFPVKAKPLVWFGKRAADYRVSKFEQDKWLPQQLSNSSGWSPKYELIGDVCATEGAAKAACEAHHQARFLEMMA